MLESNTICRVTAVRPVTKLNPVVRTNRDVSEENGLRYAG